MGYSYSEIIEIIEKTYGVRLSKSHVSEWLRGVHSPFRGCRMPTVESLEPSPDLAYVIGVICGDGYDAGSHKRLRRDDRFRIGLMVKDAEFAAKF